MGCGVWSGVQAPPCRRAQEWPQSSLSCCELFPAPRGRRARGDARAAARGPHRCKERVRARTPIERERARREPGRSLLDGVKVPRHRRDVVPVIASARWRERVHVKRERERIHERGRENALTRQPTQGSKAGGGGERADANSEFARKYNLDDKELGTGAFSRVILATSNEGTKVAVKCMCVSRRPVV